MNKYIYALVESYYDSTEQMNRILKDAKSLAKAEEKARESRINFIKEILGKTTYRKFDNDGLFAPVPLNALNLTKKDFDNLLLDYSGEKTFDLIKRIQIKYYRNDFSVKDIGNDNILIKTDIVFKTIDNIVDFFYCVLSCFKKTYHTEEINWKPIVKKFRDYLK